jgi:hypothetical protein
LPVLLLLLLNCPDSLGQTALPHSRVSQCTIWLLLVLTQLLPLPLLLLLLLLVTLYSQCQTVLNSLQGCLCFR